MIFRFLSELSDNISIYRRNSRLFEFCVNWLKPNYPVADKWLNIYRQCEFNDTSNNAELAYVKKYKSRELNLQNYKLFKKYMKVSFYCIMTGQLERYKNSNYISQDRLQDLKLEMKQYLKKSEKDIEELLESFEKFVSSVDYSNKISSDCFNNSINFETKRELSNFFNNFKDYFEFELIEGQIKI